MQKSENTFISSTFWGERTGYVAALSTINEFVRTNAFKKIKENGKKIKQIWNTLSSKHKIPIKVMGSDSIPSFEFKDNHNLNKMLENKILATNVIYVNIFHNGKNLKKYERVLNNVFFNISKKNIKKIIKTKLSFKPINRIN